MRVSIATGRVFHGAAAPSGARALPDDVVASAATSPIAAGAASPRYGVFFAAQERLGAIVLARDRRVLARAPLLASED